MELESLNEIERRVLGVLMEKSIAQPEYYPMTVNAVVTGCNQKSNRDPVMDLDESSVESTLEQLRKRGLTSVVLPAPGARTNRYRHETGARFGWEKRVTAIMTELLLRGPQTAGELRGRASRLATFENVEAVSTALEHMKNSDRPLVRPLPRQAGQSAVRFMHLMYPPEELAAIEALASSAAGPVGGGAASSARVEQASVGSLPVADSLRAEIQGLKSEVARLDAELTDLRQRFESLESQLK
jgi:uncharacterized protein